MIRKSFGAVLAIAAAPGAMAASDFWNRKPPADWSPDEIHKLMSRSPWAQEVSIGMAPSSDRPNGGAPDPVLDGIPGMAGGAPGGPMGPAGMAGPSYPVGGGARGAQRNSVATVRWESAQPILEATKQTLPQEFAGHYVVAVAGLPVDWGLATGRGRRRGAQADEAVRVSDLIDRLKAGATLEAKGREPEGAGVVKRSASDEAWLFGFSKELLPLGSVDKDVDFSLQAGPMIIRARFSPKQMTYKGQLAI